MMKTATWALLLVSAVGLSACADNYGRYSRYDRYEREGPPPGPPPPEFSAAPRGQRTEMQIERAKDRYSRLLVAMDADGIAAMYTPDGVMQRQSGGPLRGRDQIRTFLASAPPGLRVVSNEMRTISLAYNGPDVIQTGEFRQSSRVNNKVTNASGRFEATWVRGPRGDWFIRHMVTRPNN